MMKTKKKPFLIIIASLLLFSCTLLYYFQWEKNSVYTNTIAKEEYAPDFKLKKGITYYSILKSHDENILFFWASTCSHCEKAIEYMKTKKIYSKIKNRVFTVSIDEKIDDVKYHSKDFPIYLDYNYKIFKKYKCNHVPSMFIVNSGGKIIGSSEGGNAVILLLDEFIDHNY
ncbi:MAG: TlpA disulfide reductase family protein [Bacilli bacterium]